MTSNIYITPRTSLVLIKSLAQETNIYMSTYNVPDFQINIRDATGSENLLTNPINICTINGARFTNNTTHYAINQPFGFVNLSLRTSTLWQILHTSGQTPSESAANVDQTNISTAYLGLVSSAIKQVSTLFLENLETPNSIQLVGPFVIGNLSTPGFVELQSTLNIYGDATFEKNVFVSGATEFLSTLSATELLPLSSVFQTYSSLFADGSVFVKGTTQIVSTLETQSTLQVDSLQVQKSTIEFTTYLSSLFVEGTISTLRDIQTSTLVIGENFTVGHTVSALQGLFSTGSLLIEGNLLTFNNISTLNSAIFQSSLVLESSLTILNTFDILSTANVGKLVSTTLFSTAFLSTSVSFSTFGPLFVESNIIIRGTLSTNSLSVLNLFSVGGTFVTLGSISASQETRVSSLNINGNLLVRGLSTQSIGIDGNATITGNTNIGDYLFVQSNTLTETIVVEGKTLLSTVGVASDIRVIENITIDGQTAIEIFDVTSFGISSLQITTSSPSVALRASTLISPIVESLQGKFVFTPSSGSLSTYVNSSIQASSLYANIFESAFFSTQTLYTNSVLSDRSLVSVSANPQFEILQNAVFQRGLSTTFVNSELIQGTVLGNFIGDGRNIENVPLLFSTISASLVLVSTIQTSLFSANRLGLLLRDIFISTNITTNTLACQGITGQLYFFSTGHSFSSEFLSTISGFGVAFFPAVIEQPSKSILGFNSNLYLDAETRRVGIGISSPKYNLDISGALFYTGFLEYNEIGSFYFSTNRNPFFFSSLSYSTAIVRDSLILPDFGEDDFTGLILEEFTGTGVEPIDFVYKSIFIKEKEYPISEFDSIFTGIRANRFFSTIDFNFLFFIHNDTKNVGMNTIAFNFLTDEVSPAPIPSEYDLYLNNDAYIINNPILVSSANIFGALKASALEFPALSVNSGAQSNTITSPFFSTLVLNNFVEVIKDTTLKGSFQIKRPSTEPLKYLFSVYGNSYVSSITTNTFGAATYCYGFQDI